jgi:hypothetical protein
MRKLELVGLDTDGRYVVFADEAGDEYVTPADERLRAALRGDRARLGQLEIDMDSALRPRDIQARIRAGETPEAVAIVAQVSVEKIMPYCVPVLAERRHISDLARRHHVRRKNAEGPARSLDSVVSDRLRSRGIDPDATEWDAWRRDDERWSVRATYRSGEQEHRADFVFDSIGRYALADDDEAKWLTGEQQRTRKGPQPREGGRSGERRLSSVWTGDDLLSLSGESADVGADDDLDDELTDDLTAVVRAVAEPEAGADLRAEAGSPIEAANEDVPDYAVRSEEAFSDDDASSDRALPDEGVSQDAGREEPSDDVAEAADVEESPSAGERPEPGLPATATPGGEVASELMSPPASPVEATPDRRRRSARRASVPSWDEIMLGKRKDEGS